MQKPLNYIVVFVFLIGLYITGILMSLFGPSAGRFLGIPAFIGTVSILAMLDFQQRDGTLRYLAEV